MGQEQGLTNYTYRSDTIKVATALTTPHVQIFLGDFWDNQFFDFGGGAKNFFEPKKPYLALETPLFWGGGHTTYGKIAVLFGLISPGNHPNHDLDQKVLEVWPPKQGFMGTKKFFAHPPNQKKKISIRMV